MSNFIPHEIKRLGPRGPPRITKPLKTLLRKKNRLFKNYKIMVLEDKTKLDAFRTECQQAVESAKLSYLSDLGNKLYDPATSQTS